jgi:hypothetical protein
MKFLEYLAGKFEYLFDRFSIQGQQAETEFGLSALGKAPIPMDYTNPARLTLVSYRRQLKKPPHPRQDQDHDGYPNHDP